MAAYDDLAKGQALLRGERAYSPRTGKEIWTAVVFGIVGIFTGFGSGMQSLVNGGEGGQARGMNARLSFQIYTIFALVFTANYIQRERAEYKHLRDLVRQHQRLMKNANTAEGAPLVAEAEL